MKNERLNYQTGIGNVLLDSDRVRHNYILDNLISRRLKSEKRLAEFYREITVQERASMEEWGLEQILKREIKITTILLNLMRKRAERLGQTSITEVAIKNLNQEIRLRRFL